jgi:hypothetical protein
LEIGRTHRLPNQGIRLVGGWQPFVFCHQVLGEDESEGRGVIMVKQPGLFSPKFGATSSHISTQSSQNVAVEFTVWPAGSNSLCYHNCCIDGGNSPQYFGYHLVQRLLNFTPYANRLEYCLYTRWV